MRKRQFLFDKKRYIILILSIIMIGIGFILMSGGNSDNPDIFNNEIFNFRRIKLAPLVVIFGFTISMFAILYRDNDKK